jgi:hypothetical protein
MQINDPGAVARSRSAKIPGTRLDTEPKDLKRFLPDSRSFVLNCLNLVPEYEVGISLNVVLLDKQAME